MSLTLTIGPATDYLYGLAQKACAGVTASLDGQAVAAQAVDGWPHELAPLMFVVGIDQPPPQVGGATTGSLIAPLMGTPSGQEDYQVPCYIDALVPDTTVQKTPRDLVASIFNPFWNALMTDRSLGGLLQGGGAQIVNVNSIPMNTGTAAVPGRRQLMTFSVRCTDLQLG